MISTPDLSDQFDQHVNIVEPLFKHYGNLKQGYGQITTIDCFEDNSLVVKQVKSPGEGRMLVVDGGGSLRCSLLGDQLATAAIENGWSGILIGIEYCLSHSPSDMNVLKIFGLDLKFS